MKSIEDQAEEYADALLDIAEAVGSYHWHTSRTIVESADILASVRRMAEERAHLVRENALLREALESAEKELVHLFTVLPIGGVLPSPSVMQHVQSVLLPNPQGERRA